MKIPLKKRDYYKEREKRRKKEDAAIHARDERMRDLHEKLYAESGARGTNNRLVAFLYQLMRDHLTPGVVQQLLIDNPRDHYKLTNGYLAGYAQWVAKELRR